MNWLVERMGTDDELDLLILGMFAEVQDSISLEHLNEAMRSHSTQTRVTAKELMVTIGALGSATNSCGNSSIRLAAEINKSAFAPSSL